mmetsp:Transcript_1477/g.3089  ORF Transcript_1477/g.3089 Transcript_1477/m.3089 type:complete len:287 (-) Transcript_1477:1286-2146(-)
MLSLWRRRRFRSFHIQLAASLGRSFVLRFSESTRRHRRCRLRRRCRSGRSRAHDFGGVTRRRGKRRRLDRAVRGVPPLIKRAHDVHVIRFELLLRRLVLLLDLHRLQPAQNPHLPSAASSASVRVQVPLSHGVRHRIVLDLQRTQQQVEDQMAFMSLPVKLLVPFEVISRLTLRAHPAQLRKHVVLKLHAITILHARRSQRRAQVLCLQLHVPQKRRHELIHLRREPRKRFAGGEVCKPGRVRDGQQVVEHGMQLFLCNCSRGRVERGGKSVHLRLADDSRHKLEQ